jgi:transposase
MNYIIGCDAHKHYSQFAVLDHNGQLCQHKRVEHEAGAIRRFLERYPEGTPVALESIGNWYWIVDEIEAAGCVPLMAHAVKAKVMMGNVNKNDKLDAKGLATLLRLDSLPTVWIPPGSTRDARELPRTRMALVKMRTALKNRIHATLAKYHLSLKTESDIFAAKWRPALLETILTLPPETRRCLRQELELHDQLSDHIRRLEARIQETVRESESMQLLQTLPGVGVILAIVIDRELGSIARFPSAEHCASYAGTVPTHRASGGRIRYGRMRKQANQYLKWAFVEAANAICRHRNHPAWRRKHVTRLFERLRRRRGHAIAIGAVARHLSEAAFWMLTRQETYRDPADRKKVLPKQG